MLQHVSLASPTTQIPSYRPISVRFGNSSEKSDKDSKLPETIKLPKIRPKSAKGSAPEGARNRSSTKPTESSRQAGINESPQSATDCSVPSDESMPEVQESTKERFKKWTKEWFKAAFRGMLNVFHIGAALFILAGASAVALLHAPLWAGVIAMIGIPILQDWVHKKFPYADVMNKDQMHIISHKIMRKYDYGMVKGRRILRKIPFLGKKLEKPYKAVTLGIRSILQRGIDFFMTQIVHNTVITQKMPESTAGKIWYVAKILLKQATQFFLAPFGPVAKWADVLFNLTDASDFAEAFAPKKSQKNTRPKPTENTQNSATSPTSAEGTASPTSVQTAPDNGPNPSDSPVVPPASPANNPFATQPKFSQNDTGSAKEKKPASTKKKNKPDDDKSAA